MSVVVGWCEGAVQLSVPGRPTDLDNSMRLQWLREGLFGHFSLVYSFLFFFSLSGRWPDID